MATIKLDCGECLAPLRLVTEATGFWRVVGACPHCGAVVSSEPLPRRRVRTVDRPKAAQYTPAQEATIASMAGKPIGEIVAATKRSYSGVRKKMRRMGLYPQRSA